MCCSSWRGAARVNYSTVLVQRTEGDNITLFHTVLNRWEKATGKEHRVNGGKNEGGGIEAAGLTPTENRHVSDNTIQVLKDE